MQVGSIQTGCSSPPSKLRDIGGQLQLLHRKSALLQPTNSVQDSEEVSRLLEDLQDTIDNYMVCLQLLYSCQC